MWNPYESELWDKLSRAIMPESHAESVVNQIYGQNTRANDVPEILARYNPDLGDWPAPVVRTTQRIQTTIAETKAAIGDTMMKYTIVAVALILAGLLLYGFLPAFGRKLAR